VRKAEGGGNRPRLPLSSEVLCGVEEGEKESFRECRLKKACAAGPVLPVDAVQVPYKTTLSLEKKETNREEEGGGKREQRLSSGRYELGTCLRKAGFPYRKRTPLLAAKGISCRGERGKKEQRNGRKRCQGPINESGLPSRRGVLFLQLVRRHEYSGERKEETGHLRRDLTSTDFLVSWEGSEGEKSWREIRRSLTHGGRR